MLVAGEYGMRMATCLMHKVSLMAIVIGSPPACTAPVPGASDASILTNIAVATITMTTTFSILKSYTREPL
jgi:hypothetical protein